MDEHEYMHAHGIAHTHEHSHEHGHFHSQEEKKRQISRINRIIGHLEHIKKMIEADDDCSEVITQLSAVRSAVSGLAKMIISEHISHCITHAVEDGDTKAVEDFKKSIEHFIK